MLILPVALFTAFGSTSAIFPRQNFSGIAPEAASCLSEWYSWSTSSSDFVTPTTTIVSSTTGLGVEVNTDVPLTTYCEGRPRAVEPFTTEYITTTYVLPTPIESVIYPDFDKPTPSCTIAETDCTAVISIYSNDPERAIGTHCQTSATACPTTSVNDCKIRPFGSATLHYWPVTTIDGDFCARNGSTATLSPTISGTPNTVVVGTNTFTSPTPYLEITGNLQAALYTGRYRVNECGPSVTGPVVLPLASPISTNRGKSGQLGTFPFDFGDLATSGQPQALAVPTGPWDGQNRCWGGGDNGPGSGCPTIQGAYIPKLEPPNEIIEVRTEWVDAGCVYYPTDITLDLRPLGD